MNPNSIEIPEGVIRVCKKCNLIKSITKFAKSKVIGDKIYYKHSCVACIVNAHKNYYQEYYKKNKDKPYYTKKKKTEQSQVADKIIISS